MTRFLRTKYENVEIVFIAHHTEAKEVSEEQFFTKGKAAEPFVPPPTGKLWKLLIPAIRMTGIIFTRSTFRMETI